MSARDAAVDWFVRRRGALSTGEDAAFESWLAASPEHAAAYAQVEDAWATAVEAEGEPQVAALRWAAGRRRLAPRRAIAAGIAAAVMGAAAFGIVDSHGTKSLADQSFKTGVGQQATVTLPDGSSVTLNTDTVVRTRADSERRLVYLDKGQAFFKVAKDRRHPFVVTAGRRTVTALGTAFDVRLDGGELKVLLVEGKVRVQGPAPGAAEVKAGAPRTRLSTDMAPGSQLIAPAGAEWRLSPADAERETSWTRGQIVFDDEPLGEVVKELNRYSTRKIVLADSALASVRLSGIFRPGDLEGFARALKTSGLGEVAGASGTEFRVVSLKQNIDDQS